MAATTRVPSFLRKLKDDGAAVARKHRNNGTPDICGRFLALCNKDERREWLDVLVCENVPEGLLGEIIDSFREHRDIQHRRTIRTLIGGGPLPVRPNGVVFCDPPR